MGLLKLYSKTTFTKKNGDEYVFRDYTNGMESSDDVETLTNTFKITIPRSSKFKGINLFASPDPIFEVGDAVKAEMGYFPNLETVFEGWVSAISAKIPCEINCEDDMWLLKNMNVTYPQKRNVRYYSVNKRTGKISKKPLKKPKITSAEITLKELMEHLLPPEIFVDADLVDVNLGQFRITNASIAKVLDELKSKYGLYCYFIDRKLQIGLPYNPVKTNTVKFVFEKVTPYSVIDDSNLEYQLEKDISVKVVAKLMGLNNTFEEVTVGDADGAQRSLHFYWDGKTLPKPDIKALANLELDNSRYDGFRGSFETFGFSRVNAGDIVQLESTKLPERNGSYLVKSVQRKFGMEGYRQNIELGKRVI